MNFGRFHFKKFLGGLAFALVSGAMLAVIAQEEKVTDYLAYQRGIETPCTIISAEVKERQENGINSVVDLRFRYKADGKIHEGRWSGPTFKNRSATQEEIEATLTAHRPGTTSACRIIPNEYGRALIQAEFPWSDFFAAIFTSGFLLMGIYLMCSAVEKPRARKRLPSDKRTGRIAALLLGTAFAGIGYGMLWKIRSEYLSRPDISTWVNTPCLIEAASVRKRSGKRAHNHLEVRYSYRIGENRHRGMNIRPGMSSVSVSGIDDTLVAQYAVGSQSTCRVDPANPKQAVLTGPKDEAATLMVGTTFFGVFAAIGTLLIVGCTFDFKQAGTKRFQKLFFCVFAGGAAAALAASAIFLPEIRVNGFVSDSWIIRVLFGLAPVIAAALLIRHRWRSLDAKPTKENTPLPGAGKKRGRKRR